MWLALVCLCVLARLRSVWGPTNFMSCRIWDQGIPWTKQRKTRKKHCAFPREAVVGTQPMENNRRLTKVNSYDCFNMGFLRERVVEHVPQIVEHHLGNRPELYWDIGYAPFL